MNYFRSIEEIVETLQNAKARGKCCTLLIGAGCSVKAGIPTATGFVEVIKQRYPHAYNRALEKTYPKCTAELLVSERRDLIAEYVDKAKINWAHVCIALLMQAGCVDRVLTTNFDLLVARACALLGEFPAIYDFAASQLYKAADIPSKAVFYLHGQRTGFVLINTEEDFSRHSQLLGPVFEDAGRGRVWVVVGYSGKNDPVFEHLGKIYQFDNGLYWVGYQDSDPDQHVREKLLIPGKDAFYTKGFDADSFFITLTQKLQIFPPDLISHPFTHLDRILEVLTPYTLPGQKSEEDVTRMPRQWIKIAIENYEKKILVETSETSKLLSSLIVAAQRLLMAGDYDGVIAFREQYEKTPSKDFSTPICWAYIMKGNALSEQAKTKTGKEADHLFTLAGEKYQAAFAIKPDKHEALNNWGNALSAQAKTKTGEEADHLFALARDKLSRAEDIKPGSGSYNFACLYALIGDEPGCHEWFKKSQQFGTLPSRKHLMGDPDLKKIRECEWFKTLLPNK